MMSREIKIEWKEYTDAQRDGIAASHRKTANRGDLSAILTLAAKWAMVDGIRRYLCPTYSGWRIETSPPAGNDGFAVEAERYGRLRQPWE